MFCWEKSQNCWVLHSKLGDCVCWQCANINAADGRGRWGSDEAGGRQERQGVMLRRCCEFNFEAVSICARQQMVCRRRVTADQWTPDWFRLYLDFLTPGIKRHSRPISTFSGLAADQGGARWCTLISVISKMNSFIICMNSIKAAIDPDWICRPTV